jgi:hypothetical protein
LSALPLAIRGWTLAADPDSLVREVLGAAAEARTLEGGAAGWRNEDPQAPEHPVGPIRSLIGLRCRQPAEVRFVPGSQGQGPPPEDAGHAVVRVEMPAGSTLLLDGRCWYDGPDLNVSISFWSLRPGLRS